MATIEEIQADITAAREQRRNVALGTAVVEVWRDGRRMKLQVTSIEQLNDYIASLERDLAQAQTDAGQPPRRRRRAVRLAWR